MVKSLQSPRNRFCGLLFRFRQIIRGDKCPPVLRCVRVVQPVMVIHQCLPGIDSRTVRPVVIGLEPFSARQLHIRDDKIQLKTPLVLVLHPQDAVLIFFKTGHQYPLKALHHPFTLSRWQGLLCKRQNPRGVFFRKRRRIDEFPHLFGSTPQNSRPFPVTLPAQQVINRTTATAFSPGMKLNYHPVLPVYGPHPSAHSVHVRWPSVQPPHEPGHAPTTVHCLSSGLSDSGYCRPKRTGATAAVPVSEDLTFSMAVPPGRPYASMTQVVFPHNVPAAAHVPHP
ncbi:hypothetical protein EC960107_5592 [Escherichia coli 96.0107]|uniref:Uncharacterized protein n=1 Tax=Escherichia coli TaxID=562 RepID=O52996_ECOLX|nr:hypothetical protein ECFRIK1997_5989 [Escherichia coli FRIK1997]EKJ29228.1 hypothetical protein ECEC1865_6411 [Escherichia coli EC1865]EKJ65404.1 hypothetical protein ECFRIK523_5971 [Escherichia coli FRIK523]EKW58223.1 hypothetical protein EC960107_5592 [Escherichia coli 96.0107]EKY44438.1 hypothetical protein EC960109_5991 [Escherichia coli 96.0109]CAA71432.1 unknown [Escherichia coli]